MHEPWSNERLEAELRFAAIRADRPDLPFGEPFVFERAIERPPEPLQRTSLNVNLRVMLKRVEAGEMLFMFVDPLPHEERAAIHALLESLVVPISCRAERQFENGDLVGSLETNLLPGADLQLWDEIEKMPHFQVIEILQRAIMRTTKRGG